MTNTLTQDTIQTETRNHTTSWHSATAKTWKSIGTYGTVERSIIQIQSIVLSKTALHTNLLAGAGSLIIGISIGILML